MKTKELKIPNLKCMGCVNTVQTNLKRMDGVVSINSNLSTKTIVVEFDENLISPEAMVKTLGSIGYPVE